ncbi:HAD-like domain-containing protein [Cynara cardunculus var. scolymus]|uniref:riboflavin kinase n=1 Tax=Cynara cardunculus var. scolymus TaxID=59895 RepID=A0A103XF48_CYNCS|nr:HAD-like domain-containing protein [Cynara cardunculus var. scolymus]
MQQNCVVHSSFLSICVVVSVRRRELRLPKFVNASLKSSARVLVLTKWMMNSVRKLVSCVILDLDGTLVNTDGIVCEVLKAYLVKYEKKWDGREAHKIIGKTPIEAAAAIVEDYGLPLSKEDLLSEISPMFSDQWCKLKALPGAYRLITHLRGHGVQMALASNSPRASIETKISYHPTWKESFSAIIAGDEVKSGKPSPEIFLEAAKRLSIDPSKCLVIEDSLPGITAAKAAEMEVVAVPSQPKQSHLYTAADEVINSLLDLRPENWEPWHIGGPVIKGYGRGSKVLGIPTANLSVEGYATVLAEHPAGVYFGWAKLSNRGVYKMVMSLGWNPYFNNTEKTIANFPSLESLVAKIHEDGKIAENALELPSYAKYKDEKYFTSIAIGEDGHL